MILSQYHIFELDTINIYSAVRIVVKEKLKISWMHRLNMELDLQSLFGLHVHSCTHCLSPRNPPPPNLGSYTRALLVLQIDDISL